MKVYVILFSISIFVFFISCDNEDEFSDNCKGWSAGTFKHGYSYAKGSYEDFGEYSIFVRERMADTVNGGWMHDPVEKTFFFTTINDRCTEKMEIGINNITLSLNDTINLFYSRLGTGLNEPTADLDYLDADAIIEQYDLIDSEPNWLIIKSINSDTTEIEGRFNLSFVTTYEPYLTGERERWDDPNRPDTLHFTNGEFRAVFADF